MGSFKTVPGLFLFFFFFLVAGGKGSFSSALSVKNRNGSP